MKTCLVLVLMAAVAFAAPQGQSPDAAAEIVQQDSDNIGVGGYNYNYKTSNGIAAEEHGQLADAGTENEGIEVQGKYEYVGPDNVVYIVTYTAGRNGFVPSGAHLPQSL